VRKELKSIRCSELRKRVREPKSVVSAGRLFLLLRTELSLSVVTFSATAELFVLRSRQYSAACRLLQCCLLPGTVDDVTHGGPISVEGTDRRVHWTVKTGVEFGGGVTV